MGPAASGANHVNREGWKFQSHPQPLGSGEVLEVESITMTIELINHA